MMLERFYCSLANRTDIFKNIKTLPSVSWKSNAVYRAYFPGSKHLTVQALFSIWLDLDRPQIFFMIYSSIMRHTTEMIYFISQNMHNNTTITSQSLLMTKSTLSWAHRMHENHFTLNRFHNVNRNMTMIFTNSPWNYRFHGKIHSSM